MTKKAFRLNRYFSVASLIGIIAVVVVVVFFYHQKATTSLIEQQTRSNTELTETYANAVWPVYGHFIESASTLSADELRDRPETAMLRETVLQKMGGTNVVKIKIYSLDGITVFSTEAAQIGEDKSDNSGFLAACKGRTASELTYREEFSAFEDTISDRNVLSSYVPIFDGDGQNVVAVFELYSDVTDLVTATDATITQVVIVVGGSMLLLYLFLLSIIRRADRILKAQILDRQRHLLALEAANEEIQMVNDELEEEVDRRTEKLRGAMERAESANEAKTQFLATISHEIRTPISGVLGLTELLLDTELDPEQRHLSETVQSSGQALLAVINDVLDLSKIEAGKRDLEEAWFSLETIILNVQRLFSDRATQKGVLLRVDGSVLPPGVSYCGDQVAIQQVATNLVDNAIKFTESGEVRLRVISDAGQTSTKSRPTDGISTVRFEVTDTGVGIDLDAQARIFDAFSQADSSTTRRYGGTGLGLTICQQLVEAMDGEIGVDSHPGSGTRFWFTIPLIVGQTWLHTTETEVDEPREALAGRVLLAEDHDVNREIAHRHLEWLGCDVTAVTNGRAAVDAAASGEYDVILMDWNMPELDGLEAARSIRRAERNRASSGHVAIIGLTANAMAVQRERCLAAGMDDYLSKPFTRDQLRSVIERWLPSAGTADPGERDQTTAREATYTPTMD